MVQYVIFRSIPILHIYGFASGMSGHVVIDSTMGREPSFALKVFDRHGKLTTVLQAEMYKQDGEVENLSYSF